MTFRKQVLAGLVAALAVPIVAQAASSGPTRYDIEQNPALKSASPAESAKNVRNTRDRSFNAREVEADKAWTDRHQQAMQKGADHMAASIEAGQR